MACRYAHHLVAMRDGAVAAEGTPAEVVTPALVREVFDLDAHVIEDPLTGTPLVLPVPTRNHHAPAPLTAPSGDNGSQPPQGAH